MSDEPVFKNGLAPKDYAKWIALRMQLMMIFVSIFIATFFLLLLIIDRSYLGIFLLIIPCILFSFIFCGFLFLYAKNSQTTALYLQENRTVIKGDYIYFYHKVYPIYQTLVTKIEIENIQKISEVEMNYWKERVADTKLLFKLLYLAPKPTLSGLYLIYSKPKDLVNISLKRSVEIINFSYSVTPRDKYYSGVTNNIIVNIDLSQKKEFIRCVDRMIK